MKHPSLPIAVLSLIFCVWGQVARAADATPANPNILVILADDLGYGDVQCYNPQRGKIPTPNIDKLASQGMRFTDGHSSSGVCSPSRYALLTGRYHWRTRLQNGIVDVFGEPLIAPNRMTLGTLAKQHGYRAAAFIGAAARKPEPFLLYLPLTTPHTPLSVIEAWKNKSGLNAYADFVMQTDATVGRVLDALEKSGAADKTLVVFTSDNGCAPYIGAKDLEKMGHYPSGPLRGYKADAWEGGHRVPFIVRWPGIVKLGSVCHQLVHQADLLRTFADILGTKLPDNAGEDSFNLLPLLRGADKPIRAHAVSASSGGVPAVRLGNWKYIPAPDSGGWGTGGDRAQPVQLYNLTDDLGETKNLAAAEPEKVAEMKTLLEKLITVVLLGGQSNTSGRTPATNLPPDSADSIIEFFYDADITGAGTPVNSGSQFVPLAPPGGTFGPEFTLARTLYHRHGLTNLAIIKRSKGAQASWCAQPNQPHRSEQRPL